MTPSQGKANARQDLRRKRGRRVGSSIPGATISYNPMFMTWHNDISFFFQTWSLSKDVSLKVKNLQSKGIITYHAQIPTFGFGLRSKIGEGWGISLAEL